MIPSSVRVFLVAGALPLMVGALAVPPAFAAPALASVHDAGAWDLTFEKGNRRCRMFLRTEAVAKGFAIAMPAVCHKAFPALAGVASWTANAAEHLMLSDAAGAVLFDFAPDGTTSLKATPIPDDIYTMTPVSPAVQEALRAFVPGAAPDGSLVESPSGAVAAADGVLVEKGAARTKGTAKPAVPPKPALPPTTVAAVAGNYAVLRQDRDTGCMVTLETVGRSTSALRAHLAPACRDQGIVVFDPSGWQLLHSSELVLTAKRGHTTALTRRDETTWSNSPASGAPLVLKRL